MVLDVAQNVNDEKAVQRFACALLMPVETVQTKIGARRKRVNWEKLFHLKRIFGMSMQAIVYCCNEIGIFSNTLYRKFFKEFTRHG